MSDSLTFSADFCWGGDAEQPRIEAESQADGLMRSQGPRRFKVNAYTGGMIRQEWSREPIVVDLKGMQWTNKRRPILLQHSYELDSILGQTTDVRVEGQNLVVEGEMIGGNANAEKVIALAERGFQWQASIGADVLRSEKLPANETAVVNGQTITGPARIIRQSRLREVSVVTLGADDNTSASLAASAAKPEELSMADEVRDVPVEQTPAIQAAAPVAAPVNEEAIASLVAEKIMAANRAAALEATRASRPAAPAIHVAADSEPRLDILQAAACLTGKLQDVEKHFDERTLEAASKRYKRGIGLCEMLIEAARVNGYSGRETMKDDSCARPILRAAFATHDIADILSATVNKFLLQGFTAVDQVWRSISTIRPVNDFKAVTGYRLTGGFKFEEMAENGEFKNAVAGNVSYTNRARTYGIATNVSREQLINDDLSALTAIPSRIGRGAALKLNEVFWTAFLNNSDFFKNANKNYASGSSSAFGVDGITAAERLFLEQVDYDGYPVAISPKLLLVPPALNTPALSLLRATELRDTTASNKYVTVNPHAGKYQPLVTPYLANQNIAGSSNTAYYLLADPADLATIEVCFLNGVEQPTVEQADLDFSMLGIQFRGYFDMGVTLVEPRAAVKMAGA